LVKIHIVGLRLATAHDWPAVRGILPHCRLIGPAQEDAFMAKKMARKPDDRFGEVETGIYRRQRVALKRSDRPLTKTEKQQASNELARVFADRREFADWTAALVRELEEISNCGDSETERDARHAHMQLRMINSMVSQIKHPYAERLVDAAVMLGELLERISVRPFESAAAGGLTKSRQSRQNAHDTNKKRAAKRPDYHSEVVELMATGIRYDPACQRVANNHGVVKETVRNNTLSLRPRPKKK
jgi:hypothetical protein